MGKPMKSSTEYQIAQGVEVVYDPENGLHRGADTSAESPERVAIIVKALTELGLPIKRYQEPNKILPTTFTRQNCCACTSELNPNEKRCWVCGSKPNHVWTYTQDVDGDTTFETPYTTAIVARARDMILQAAQGAMSRSLTVCLSRPPGHHACSDKKRKGFCHANFIVDALDYFHSQGKRAVIVDIDAHHGDGTEYDILQRNYGFYTSIHGYGPNVYPGTGNTSSERVLNLPLPKDSNTGTWLNTWHSKLLPFVSSKQPDIILLSCGLDAHESDVLAPLNISTECYGQIGKDLKALNLPVFAVLEGGYCLQVLGESMKALVGDFLSQVE